VKPLDDVVVLDLADEPAIFAGRLLADLGADVIRVEPPDGGRVRSLGPFLDGVSGVERGYRHLAYNAGKRSMTLDITTSEGRDLFRRLVRRADALIESYQPGQLAALGLDFDRLAAENPRLIHVAITPFGSAGPWARRKGSDLIAAAAGGLLHVSGEPERPPVLAGGDMSYKLASLAACTGVLAALAGRGGPFAGRGVSIDISAQECVTLSTLQTSNANFWRWHGLSPRRNTAREFPIVRCRDGRYALARARPDRWDDLRAWAVSRGLQVRAGPGQWMEATRSELGSFRLGEAADIIEQLAGLYERDEFLDLCWEAELIALPVHSFDDMRRSEHLQAIREFESVRHDPLGVSLGFPKSPFTGVRDAGELRRAPLLGEHNNEVLGDAAVDAPVQRASSVGNPAVGALPLAGLRALEISWVLAGPLGARILANLGAEVIKVESEARMDSIRRAVPPPGGPDLATGGWFNGANTGKLSATINTSSQAGQDLLLRLAATCDIVINNLRPGVIERMGIPYDRLRRLNPRAIVVHMPGCGRSGPWAGLATFGNMISAAGGLNTVTGFPGTPPTGLGVAFADFVSPYLMASAVLAALHERERMGEGQEIEVAQLPGMISLLAAEWMEFDRTGEEPARRANRDPNYCPHGVYPARGGDEWVAIAVAGDDEWRAFAAAIDRPDLAGDPRFATHGLRKAHEDEVDAAVREWSRTADRWEAATMLQERGIAAAAVESLADQLDRDPSLAAYFQVVRQPAAPDLDITVYGEPIRFSGAESRVARSHGLGEDNEYVFREVVGLSEEEFAGLLAEGVIA
jgi:crotonobetainyl-CoA:carnitine CoA-transferase CaiB-like acyl-CoA transferase